MRKEFSLLLIFLIIIPSASAQNIPTIRPYVNDFVGVLSPEEINSINFLASEIEKNTTVQVAVLVVNSTQPLAIEEYANRVFRQNGIGQRGNNNGLLIVGAIADRTWRIEVGYGLEGTINDAKAGDIGRTYLVPNFQKGQYGLGLYSAVDSIGKIVQGSDDPYLISKQPTFTPAVDAFMVFFPWMFVILIVVIPGIFSGLSKCPTCGSWAWGKGEGDMNVYVCKKGHRWTKKKRGRFFFFFFPGFGRGGSGGGGFGGGSSGGGGAGGKW